MEHTTFTSPQEQTIFVMLICVYSKAAIMPSYLLSTLFNDRAIINGNAFPQKRSKGETYAAINEQKIMEMRKNKQAISRKKV